MTGRGLIVVTDIKGDLRAFADPGTEVVDEGNEILWEQNGRARTLKLFRGQPQEEAKVEFEGRRYSYTGFLASEHMSNMRQLAEFTVRTTLPQQSYIPTTARLEAEVDDEVLESEHVLELLAKRATEDLPLFSTKLLFVRGEAGSGKTVALRQLTIERARRYREGKENSLFFYVDAQGRALSRLDDAISKELDDLKSQFGYSETLPLTRRGLLIPIIDGFDELLGAGGYDDAFASLAHFLAQLGGEGVVIASARSAFFDYRDFHANAARFAKAETFNYSVETVSVKPWGAEQIKQYFTLVGQTKDKLAGEMEQYVERMESDWTQESFRLLKKPFYSARVAELLSEGVEFEAGDDLMEQLVSAFLSREVDKLKDSEGRPLLDLEGHQQFLEALSEEMWWLENRQLDVGTVQTLAELIAEERKLQPAVAMALVEKVSSYAFLSTDSADRKMLRFEHEVFYGFFLARRLAELVRVGGLDLRRFLSRSVVDDTLVEATSSVLLKEQRRLADLIENICGATRPSLADLVLRENAGKLVAKLLRDGGTATPDTRLRNLILRGVSLAGIRMEKPELENCDLQEVDLSGAVLVNPRFNKSVLRDVEVDAETRLESATLTVGEEVLSMIVKADGPARRVVAPAALAKVLREIGVEVPGFEGEAEGYSSEVQEKVDVLDRLLRFFERQFYVSNDDIKQKARHLEGWEDVYHLLVDCELLEGRVIPKSGRGEPLMSLAVPPKILRQGENTKDLTVPVEVRDFWQRLTQE